MSRYTRRKVSSLRRIIELYRAGVINRDEAEARFRRHARESILADGGDRTDQINMVALIDEVVKNRVEDWPAAIKFWAVSIVHGAPWVQFLRPATGAAS